MTKIDKKIITTFIEKEYPQTPKDTYAMVYALIDEHNNLDDMANQWCKDECQNFVTLGSSQYLGSLSNQQNTIKQRLRSMGISIV